MPEASCTNPASSVQRRSRLCTRRMSSGCNVGGNRMGRRKLRRAQRDGHAVAGRGGQWTMDGLSVLCEHRVSRASVRDVGSVVTSEMMAQLRWFLRTLPKYRNTQIRAR